MENSREKKNSPSIVNEGKGEMVYNDIGLVCSYADNTCEGFGLIIPGKLHARLQLPQWRTEWQRPIALLDNIYTYMRHSLSPPCCRSFGGTEAALYPPAG